MTDICIGACAPAGDYRHFDIKSGMNLSDMPRFPTEEFVNQMPPKVKTLVAGIYLAKVVDHLQGVELSAAPRLNSPKSRRMLEALKQQSGLISTALMANGLSGKPEGVIQKDSVDEVGSPDSKNA
jgi:hypothetical protein